jgi:hypothetical protein
VFDLGCHSDFGCWLGDFGGHDDSGDHDDFCR